MARTISIGAQDFAELIRRNNFYIDKTYFIKDDIYTLELTNYEVKKMFFKLIKTWFKQDSSNYNDFIKALLLGDVEAMNIYMNKLTAAMFSSFDVGKKPSQSAAPV